MPESNTYRDGSRYTGDWNETGQKQGKGVLHFPDDTKYSGNFESGVFSGHGVMEMGDRGRYEGEFRTGKFHGVGIFLRSDGMKFEGEFQNGEISGYGLVTFSDGTHGNPRHEGSFERGVFKQRKRCPDIIERARKAAGIARSSQ